MCSHPAAGGAREQASQIGHVACMATSSRSRNKRPCSICREWFTPDPRIGSRQRTCSEECSQALTRSRQAEWRSRNRDYSSTGTLRRRVASAAAGDPIRVPSDGNLTRIPWRAVQTQLGAKQAVVLAFALRLLDQDIQTMMAARIGMARHSPARHLTNGHETQIPPGRLCGDDPRD